MPKRVLLTGASGFVGSNLARRLLADGHELYLLMRPAWKRWRLKDVAPNCAVVEADIENSAELTALLTHIRPDWVFHLAVYGAYPGQKDTTSIMRTNAVGSVNVIDAAARIGVEALVQAGSSSEYGAVNSAPLEDQPLRPNSAYGVSKAAASMYARLAAETLGIRASTLRLYSTYGPWEEPTRLFPKLIVHALEGTLPPLAAPDSAHDFIHVDDVVKAFLLAAEHARPGAIYNIGTGIQTTLGELVELVRRMFGVQAQPAWNSLPSRPWDTHTWVANPSLAKSELGWHPTIALGDGLRRMAEWVRESPYSAL